MKMRVIREMFGLNDNYNLDMFLNTRPEDERNRDFNSALEFYRAKSEGAVKND